MGHFDATEDGYLRSALKAVGDKGVLHVHDAVHAERTEETVHRVESFAEEAGYDAETSLRTVKGYAEGVSHVVVDARVSR